MGKICTPRPHQEREETAAATSWWSLPLSRKVAHFESLIEALAAAAAAATERPPASAMARWRRARRRRTGDEGHSRRRRRRRSEAEEGIEEDDEHRQEWSEGTGSTVSLVAQLASEVERIRKRRNRRRRRLMVSQWGRIDPTMWPFDTKVRYFSELAREHRLREAIDDEWTRWHKRAREETDVGSPETVRRAGLRRRTDDGGGRVSAAPRGVERARDDQTNHQACAHVADEAEMVAADGLRRVADGVQAAVGSEYVGQAQLRCSDEGKRKRQRRRRAAHKRKMKRSRELEEERKKRKQEELPVMDHQAKKEANADQPQEQSNEMKEVESKPTVKKWQNTKWRVRRELTKLWTNKHVKRGLVHFERHLADREVLGMECLDWQKHQCRSSYVTTDSIELLPFFSHSTNALGDGSTLVVIGGKDAKGRGSGAVRLLDTNTMEWFLPSTATGPAPDFLFGHASCRVGRSIHIVGGYDQGGLSSRIYRVDVSPNQGHVTWSVSRFTADGQSAPAFCRVGHALVRYGNELLLFGGNNGKQWCNDLHAFDLEYMTWRAVPTTGAPPSPRGFHTATIVGSCMVVYGGTNVQKTFGDAYVLDLESLTWTCVTYNQPTSMIPSARHSHAAARVGESVYIFGGRSKNKVTHDCWSFEVDAQRWTRMKEKNDSNSAEVLGLSSHTLTSLGMNRLVIVGGKRATSISGDVWVASTIRLPLSSDRRTTKVIDFAQLEIGEEVGRGSFAKVLRASLQDSKDNIITCAVKKLRKCARKDDDNELLHFKQEISLLSKLDHPNVVKLVGVCTKPRCIVTEFMPGGSLSEFLRKRGSLFDNAPSLMTSIALDIAKGGQYLHHKGIIHRDIKSHNILLDKNLNAKVADLGVSRMVTDTSTMTCVGSAQWTAPEILRHQPYDQAVDVYSYGIVLWEMLSGSQPYAHTSRLEAAIAVASEQLRPEILSHWPDQWVQLLRCCWHESPAVRPTFAQIVAYIGAAFC